MKSGRQILSQVLQRFDSRGGIGGGDGDGEFEAGVRSVLVGYYDAYLKAMRGVIESG